MNQPNQTERHTSLLFVQPAMLKIVALAAAVWGIGVPIVLAIKTGDARLLLLAPLGLLLVPAILVLAMFGRVLLWLHLVLFWYIRGALAAISILAFAAVSCAVLIMPSQWIDQTAGRIAGSLPGNALAVGAIIGIVALGMIGAVLLAKRSPAAKPAAGAPAPSPAPPQPKPLTYLDQRQQKP